MRRAAIGIVAPSSRVPAVEFALGVGKLKAEGFSVFSHPQVKNKHLFFSGTDWERAQAFFDFAKDPRFPVIWCARGGYGVIRILPLLERLCSEKGRPGKKLLVGFSDATALMEYARTRWGWSALHAEMPGLRNFCTLEEDVWKSMIRWVRGEKTGEPWKRLRFVGKAPKKEIRAPMVGGNLIVWSSLLGTPFAPQARGKMLFFEEIGESIYRIDRMIHQIALSGGFDGVKAVVLGEFVDCKDQTSRVLARLPHPQRLAEVLKNPGPHDLKPLRKTWKAQSLIPKLFAEIGERFKVPVAYGLPAGHGPGFVPVPLGAEYRLDPQGWLRLGQWDWLKSSE